MRRSPRTCSSPRRSLPVAADVEVVADSVELVADSVLEVADSVELVPASVELVADSVQMVPASVELVADSVQEVADSVDIKEAPDDDKVVVVHCPRCGTFHAGGVFGEECYQARREARRCARCGLLHEDYDLTVKLHNMEKFDCEIFIPGVDKFVMRGDSIFLTDDVMNKLDEHYYAVKKLEEEAKMKKLDSIFLVIDWIGLITCSPRSRYDCL